MVQLKPNLYPAQLVELSQNERLDFFIMANVPATQSDILVVDDTPDNLRVLINLLGEQGYTVRPAASGERALLTVQRNPPDLILLDIKMPEMDGYEVCGRLKADAHTRHIPVIFISALDEVFDKVRAFGVGGIDYITKPFQAEEVIARVRTHLTLQRLQQTLEQQNIVLEETNLTLEDKVRARTAELAEANQILQTEIVRRRRQQEEKEQLLEVVRQQSDQLRAMTNMLLQAQQQQQQAVNQTLHQQLSPELTQVQQQLSNIQMLLTHQASDPQALDQALGQLSGALALLSRTQTTTQQVTTNLDQMALNRQALQANPLLNLSGREHEVLQLLVQGKSTSEIAELLIVTKSTVSTYRKRIMQKLEVESLSELIQLAMQYNLISTGG